MSDLTLPGTIEFRQPRGLPVYIEWGHWGEAYWCERRIGPDRALQQGLYGWAAHVIVRSVWEWIDHEREIGSVARGGE